MTPADPYIQTTENGHSGAILPSKTRAAMLLTEPVETSANAWSSGSEISTTRRNSWSMLVEIRQEPNLPPPLMQPDVHDLRAEVETLRRVVRDLQAERMEPPPTYVTE